MSHSLKIEVGRWSRTPPDERVCHCDASEVQTEKHVLLDCSLTAHCRERHLMLNFVNIQEMFNEKVHLVELCNFVYEVLHTFK